MRIKLRTRVFLYFVLVVALFGALCGVIGGIVLHRTTLNEAQRRVSLDLRSAWNLLDGRMEEMKSVLGVIGAGPRVRAMYGGEPPAAYRAEFETIRRENGLDFLTFTDNTGTVLLRTLEPYNRGDDLSSDRLVRTALRGEEVSGIMVLGPNRLEQEGGDLEERAYMRFEDTPKAKPRAETEERSGMAVVVAVPARDKTQQIVGTVCGGILLNRNHSLVDQIRSVVFEDQKYEGRHLGTVTVFQWDVRVATNVRKANGNRAIGTRVSEEVYDRVLENGESWYDRAFVVNDWYISAYDPIRDVDHKVVGILYVGVLAERYDDMKRELWFIYGGLSLGAGVVAIIIGLVFSGRLTSALHRLAEAAGRLEAGELDHRVPDPPTNDEVRDLTHAFNTMADSLRDREARLRAANGELQRLNANYLDMLGFVSHELKNTLGTIYTAARSLDAGLVGDLTEAQSRMVRSIRRSIDSAVEMTRHYLDLSRIEKGELKVEKADIDLVGDVVEPVLGELDEAIGEKAVNVEQDLPDSLPLRGDAALLRVVYKNLLDNALKYGREGGTIKLSHEQSDGTHVLHVWNEGEGLAPDEIEGLFRKFVRFDEDVRRKGTGLGLFITREVIEKHGGRIRAESEEGEWIDFIFTLPAED
ncbi:MAG: cache domain-containing protein [Candidatus Brocadiia bacterium]